jgi:hypothetical protein
MSKTFNEILGRWCVRKAIRIWDSEFATETIEHCWKDTWKDFSTVDTPADNRWGIIRGATSMGCAIDDPGFFQGASSISRKISDYQDLGHEYKFGAHTLDVDSEIPPGTILEL